ncbi:hypothetical protein CLV56_2826 [Mumia flava]|uniref:Uncharacterized protein n=1 Tax=Mumia flava TaxID=1348852 RepID=A0A0B2BQT0_9ACTN|nr:hypothetical protein [Mumia flava]PJJ58575.1 hypothetical protein CLV56_2826 [Mumia flava]
MTILEAAESGDRLALLAAMRGRLAGAIDDPATPPYALSSLCKELLALDRECRAESEPALPSLQAVRTFDPEAI